MAFAVRRALGDAAASIAQAPSSTWRRCAVPTTRPPRRLAGDAEPHMSGAAINAAVGAWRNRVAYARACKSARRALAAVDGILCAPRAAARGRPTQA